MQILLHEGIGGMEVMADSLGSGLEAKGHIVRTHVLDGGAQHEGETRSAAHRLRSLAGARRIFRPDVVLTHSAIPTVYDRLLPAWRTPRVGVVHSPGFDLLEARLRWAERLLAHRSSAIVFVSNDAMLLHEKFFPRCRASRICIPNGVQIPEAQPRERRVPPLKFLAVSRLTPVKDIETTLRAFSDYAAREKDATLSIVGDAADPRYEQSLKTLVRENEILSSRVSFLGRRNDVGRLMDGADLLIHSSHHEAQGLVLAESAVRGLPTAVTHPVDAVRSWRGGAVVFQPGDSSGLAASLSDARTLKALAHSVRAATDQNRLILSLDLMVDRYERLLAWVVASD